MDYSISWQYIVNRMEQKYGIKPDSTEKYSYGDIRHYMDGIWDEYFEMLYEHENTKIV